MHPCRYWHVPIEEQSQDYLGVAYTDEQGVTTFYVWLVLCLGLRDAAHIFTRLIAPIMAEIRRQGIRGQIYIGDPLENKEFL